MTSFVGKFQNPIEKIRRKSEERRKSAERKCVGVAGTQRRSQPRSLFFRPPLLVVYWAQLADSCPQLRIAISRENQEIFERFSKLKNSFQQKY